MRDFSITLFLSCSTRSLDPWFFVAVGGGRAGDQEKQDAIQRMTELTVTQEKIVPLMKGNDLQVMETVVRVCVCACV